MQHVNENMYWLFLKDGAVPGTTICIPYNNNNKNEIKGKRYRLLVIPPSAKGSLCWESVNLKTLFQRLLCPYSLNLNAFFYIDLLCFVSY